MANKKSQKELVFEYMQAYGSITQKQANDDLGVSRLSARIGELKDDGHNIDDDWVNVPRRNGERTQVKKYFLVKKGQTEMAL